MMPSKVLIVGAFPLMLVVGLFFEDDEAGSADLMMGTVIVRDENEFAPTHRPWLAGMSAACHADIVCCE
jgi:hypothetical protein